MTATVVFRDLSVGILASFVLGLLLWARWSPEDYGRWLQAVDNGRFEQIDCDCTPSLD